MVDLLIYRDIVAVVVMMVMLMSSPCGIANAIVANAAVTTIAMIANVIAQKNEIA